MTAASTSASASRPRRSDGSSFAAVLVGETHDVDFAESSADLKFDLFERYHAGIGKAMGAADWNVDRFVFMDRSEHWIDARGMAEVTVGSEIRTIHAGVSVSY